MQRMMRWITSISRIVFVLLIVIGAFVFAMFQGGVVSWTIFYALFPFVLYSLCLALYPISSFSVKRIVKSSHYQAGDRVEVDVQLVRKIPFPLLYTVVQDEWHGKQKQKLLVPGWKKSFNWTYEIDQLTRGEHVADEVKIEVTDFFGWIRKVQCFPVRTTLLVYPAIKVLSIAPLLAQQGKGVTSSSSKPSKDMDTVRGIREYIEGDQLSRIHWKSFARTETLMTKEFDGDQSENMHLLFDNRQSNSFERTVTFTASTLWAMQGTDMSINFLPLYKTNGWENVQSAERFQTIHTYLAKVQPARTDQILLSPSFIQTIGRGEGIVLITGKFDHSLQKMMEKYRTTHRSIRCFIIMEADQSISKDMQSALDRAMEKGISIQLIKSHSFKEVVSV